MLNFTPFARPYFRNRLDQIASWEGHIEEVQRSQLDTLILNGRNTLWGASRGLDRATDYETFLRQVPRPVSYEELRPWVMKMIGGSPDILWPGVTRNFAQSSGTSDGKSKYIPVTSDSFESLHYRGATDAVGLYLAHHPDSKIFGGKSFILGGSFANELDLPPEVKVGDLSANLIDNIHPMVNAVRVPSKDVALMADWDAKLPALIDAAIGEDITNISGVPSWFLTVLKGIIAKAGVKTIHEVWPNLEVFFHGGISMSPYWSQYEPITDPSRMNYWECYNASEGFFAAQDTPGSPALRLLLDCGVFYEFMPLSELDSDTPATVPAWDVKQGEVYALVITACNGLWRYPLGDTVRIESTDPLRITIAGRTKAFINAFGEELMVHNAEAALRRVCEQMDCAVTDYTAAPVFTTSRSKGRHEWVIEFSKPPRSVEEFAEALDKALQDENSDYQAKRSHDIFLDRLSVVEARRGLFDDWLAQTGKRGGQRKVPRLSNSRTIIDQLLQLNGSH
ncbi:MAG: GH3 auxin-responsive promoter family protein [Duncaniella sp.]|nr:GH3 auxin-responsive promoter family protein [Duncaniella sp.]